MPGDPEPTQRSLFPSLSLTPRHPFLPPLPLPFLPPSPPPPSPHRLLPTPSLPTSPGPQPCLRTSRPVRVRSRPPHQRPPSGRRVGPAAPEAAAFAPATESVQLHRRPRRQRPSVCVEALSGWAETRRGLAHPCPQGSVRIRADDAGEARRLQPVVHTGEAENWEGARPPSTQGPLLSAPANGRSCGPTWQNLPCLTGRSALRPTASPAGALLPAGSCQGLLPAAVAGSCRDRRVPPFRQGEPQDAERRFARPEIERPGRPSRTPTRVSRRQRGLHIARNLIH